MSVYFARLFLARVVFQALYFTPLSGSYSWQRGTTPASSRSRPAHSRDIAVVVNERNASIISSMANRPPHHTIPDRAVLYNGIFVHIDKAPDSRLSGFSPQTGKDDASPTGCHRITGHPSSSLHRRAVSV